jgi:phage terminase large subunit GpA-like protein
MASVANALLPPDDIEIDEWAEKSIELSARVTKSPGLLKLLPYQREPVQSFKHSFRVVCTFASQTGKTVMLQAIMGYIIDQDPGPCMVVYPDKSLASRRSKKHLKPLVEDSPILKKHVLKSDDLNIFEYKLDRMDIILAWSGSASQMASEPIRYLLRDEIAKFAGATDKEADSLSLSGERVKSYSWMARIFDITTPTLKTAAGWIDLENGTFKRYHVPCPHCGHEQHLVFSNIKFPSQEKEESLSKYKRRVAKETYYECAGCKGKIYEHHKYAMLDAGQWKAENPDALYESYHLPAWYAPWVSFADAALKFIDSKDDPEKLRNFINSWCCEPWEERGENTDSGVVLKHCLGYAAETIPTDEPVFLIMTTDIQKDYLWYTVRAHTEARSYLIEYGTLPNIEYQDSIIEKVYKNPSGQEYSIQVVLDDSGYLAPDVYEYAGTRKPNVIPIKGQDTQSTLIKWQNIQYYPGTNRPLKNEVPLCNIHVTHFKERLLNHFAKGICEDGGFDINLADWFLHAETGNDYARQLTGEIVIEKVKDRNGETERVWKKVRDNHLFDCEVYQLAARYMFKNALSQLSSGEQEQKPAPSTREIEVN